MLGLAEVRLRVGDVRSAPAAREDHGLPSIPAPHEAWGHRLRELRPDDRGLPTRARGARGI